MKNKKIAILGAGVTGLTAAYYLSKKGYNVTIFEKSEEVGGIASSFIDKDGCVYDYGPHQFCTDNPELVKLLKDILGKDLLIRKKNASQYFFNKYIPYPPKPLDYLTKLPLNLSLKVLIEVIISRIHLQFNSKPDYSFESWTKSRFGKTLYERYFKPYTIKTWGINPDELDPSTASSRISFNSIFDILFKTVKYHITKKDDFSTTHNPLKHKFYYPKGGNVKLMQALYNACIKSNIKLKKGYEVKRIEVKNSRITKINFSNKKGESGFDYVINTIPLTLLTKVLGKPEYPSLKFRSMIFGFISFDKKQISPYHWIYYPDRDIIFQRLCEFKHFDADMCPENKTNIVAEITCFKGDKIWESNDEEITKSIIHNLKKVRLIKGNENYTSNIKRKEFVYPLQIKGFQRMIKEIVEKDILPIQNLVTIGRQGLYKYCNQNECMEMALDATSQIIKNTKQFSYNFESKWKGQEITKTGILKEDSSKQ